MPTTTVPEALLRRIRHARLNIRHAEELQDSMACEAWRALMDTRHAELNELLDKITGSKPPATTATCGNSPDQRGLRPDTS